MNSIASPYCLLILSLLLLTAPALAIVEQGTDTDGDVYQVQLLGVGNIASSSLTAMQVAGTNAGTMISVTVKQIIGDGKVNVSSFSTGGSDLGTLRISGDLGDLACGALGTLDVQSIGAAQTASTLTISGPLGRLACPYGIHCAAMTIGGHVTSWTVGQRNNSIGVIRQSEIIIGGNVNQLTLNQSLTAGSVFDVGGNLSFARIYGDIAASTLAVDGYVSQLTISGGVSNGSELVIGGNTGQLNISKTVSDAQLNIGGKLNNARIDTDLADSTLYCAEIGSLTVSDDLSNAVLRIIGDVGAVSAGDVSGLMLAVSGRLDRFTVNRDLRNADIAALVGIGRVMVMRDVNRTNIIAGIDFGDDLTRDPNDTVDGNADIDSIFVLGEMVDTSIAAGVDAAGPSYQYGDGDDFAVNNHTGTSRIYSLIVTGQIRSTQLAGETFALTADDGIDVLTSAGRRFTGAAGVIVQEF